jgi:hypothetical protein
MKNAAKINAGQPNARRNGLTPIPSRLPSCHSIRGQNEAAVMVDKATQGDIRYIIAREITRKKPGKIKSPKNSPRGITSQKLESGRVLE